MASRHSIALALVTREELALLGPSLNRAFPVEDTPCFGELLYAIDEADRESLHRRKNFEPFYEES